eukprot:1182448-Prorocentrum_minimum.AAC.14
MKRRIEPLGNACAQHNCFPVSLSYARDAFGSRVTFLDPASKHLNCAVTRVPCPASKACHYQGTLSCIKSVPLPGYPALRRKRVVTRLPCPASKACRYQGTLPCVEIVCRYQGTLPCIEIVPLPVEEEVEVGEGGHAHGQRKELCEEVALHARGAAPYLRRRRRHHLVEQAICSYAIYITRSCRI